MMADQIKICDELWKPECDNGFTRMEKICTVIGMSTYKIRSHYTWFCLVTKCISFSNVPTHSIKKTHLKFMVTLPLVSKYEKTHLLLTFVT
jgi:hypothetical protein